MKTPKYRVIVTADEAHLNFTVVNIRYAMEFISSMVEEEMLRGPLSIQVQLLGNHEWWLP